MVLLATGFSQAEERFYPIVGPGGSITIIRSKENAEGVAAPDASPADAEGDKKDSSTSGSGSGTAASTGTGTGKQSVAPYDSDEYTSSEKMEQMDKAGETRKRFYVIKDGMGEQHLGEEGEGVTASQPLFQSVPVKAEKFRTLPRSFLEVSRDAALSRHPGLAACQAPKALKQAISLVAGEVEGFVLDKNAYTFLDRQRVLAIYRVEGEGLRTLELRSYSSKDKSPAFAHPDLMFLDAGGCLTRAVSGYYERWYPATEKRHVMLGAEITVHTEESYVMVMAPIQSAQAAVATPFRESGTGQLQFTLEK